MKRAKKDGNTGKDNPGKVCKYIRIDKRGHQWKLTIKFVFWGKTTLYKPIDRRVPEDKKGI
jgi:hypothetical protein